MQPTRVSLDVSGCRTDRKCQCYGMRAIFVLQRFEAFRHAQFIGADVLDVLAFQRYVSFLCIS